jgi:hypothetical protein
MGRLVNHPHLVMIYGDHEFQGFDRWHFCAQILDEGANPRRQGTSREAGSIAESTICSFWGDVIKTLRDSVTPDAASY